VLDWCNPYILSLNTSGWLPLSLKGTCLFSLCRRVSLFLVVWFIDWEWRSVPRYRPYHVFHCSKLLKLMRQSKWSCPYSSHEDVWKNVDRDQLILNFGIRYNWSGQPHATHTAPRGKQSPRTTEWARYLPGIKPRFIRDTDNYADYALPVTRKVLFISVCFME
jgi:hypothetical protein